MSISKSSSRIIVVESAIRRLSVVSVKKDDQNTVSKVKLTENQIKLLGTFFFDHSTNKKNLLSQL